MNAVRAVLIPPFFAAAGLVVVAGAAKLRHPGGAGRALSSLRLPSGPWTVRAIGLVEMAIGIWCLFVPGRAAALSLCLLYSAFAMILAALVRAREASCGCLGKKEAPPNMVHVILDVAAAGSAVVIAFAPPPSGVIAFSARLPLGGVPFLVGTSLIAYLAYLSVVYLPEVFWSYGGRASSLPAGARSFAIGSRPEP